MVGRVRRPHGVRGELVIEALTDSPEAVFAAGRRVFAGTRDGKVASGEPELRVQRSQPFKDGWIVAFEGVADREGAALWRDCCLLVPEGEVRPPGEEEVYVHDLVGMRVVLARDGVEIGTVREVLELPQGLVLDVTRPAGRKSALLPFDDHTVTEVDTDEHVIRVDPAEGLLD